jgi:peptide/nickel transport system permease protein
MTASPLERKLSRGSGSISLISLACSAVLIIWMIAAFLAPWLAPHGVGDVVSPDIFLGPSMEFPLGTDFLGRDMLSRVLYGARFTLGISVAAAVIACLVGSTLGMASAALGGTADALVSRLMDALNAIPGKMFGLVIVAAVGSSMTTLILTLGFLYVPGAFRIARAQAVTVASQDFVEVARARGERTLYIIRAEIWPNTVGVLLADFGLRFVFIVLLLSGLSFLGLGVQPPDADWGSLVRENITGLPFGAPAVIIPSLAIASLTIAVNLFIDTLRREI